MPGMSGNEATRIIRDREGDSRRTPIIALTAKVMEHDQKKAFDAGVDDFLSKPVFIEDIAASLQRVMYRSARGIATGEIGISNGDRQSSGTHIIDKAMIDELRKIKGKGDGNLFAELADQFRLLGLCQQIGADRMAALCVRLEQMGDEDADEAMVSEVALLQREFEAAHRELDDRHLSD